MGTDNLFHKHKARIARDLKRSRPKRSLYEKVLIVCEGAKTEPNYFHEIVAHYKLNTANVAIHGKGSGPGNVLDEAIRRYKLESGKGDPYDRVYCIFDKDQHTSYKETLKLIEEYDPKGIIYKCSSVPCFEYWLILHFKYTTKPYAPIAHRSAAQQVLVELRKYMPQYSKGSRYVFGELQNKLEFAKENAGRSLAEARKNYTDNPSTEVHELVQYLQNLQSPN